MGTDDLLAWAGTATWLGLGLAAPLLLLEGFWPRLAPRSSLGRRWLANAAVWGGAFLTLTWLPQWSLVAVSLVAAQRGWGLFHVVDVPAAAAILLSWLAIDLSGYLVHRAEHGSRLLWRLHRAHHSDPDVDVTTTYRFHPLEVLLRSAVQAGVALALGIPLAAAVLHLVTAAVSSPLSHANVRLPALLERALGWLIITPAIHRTHHSLDAGDSNTNFAVCLSCWDRLLGTFRSAPRAGESGLRFGVPGRSAAESTSIPWLLADPLLPDRLPARTIDAPDSRADDVLTGTRGSTT